MATQHEIEMALNLVDRGARVAITAGEMDDGDISLVVQLVSGCSTPRRIGHLRLSEAAALALTVQLGEALGL
ncbi:hypothetical protein [Thauera humireducens]|uniref:Uncharacterized protein n=1 Tax=Thauera humireducens TaxID=1134435 RepID=A0A127K427_9RHOO|nr:hypothetical protein [Thauera humireducens]AMO36708.1 hypothetical protein AC731_006995 [Thauera humireducens]